MIYVSEKHCFLPWSMGVVCEGQKGTSNKLPLLLDTQREAPEATGGCATKAAPLVFHGA